MKKLFTIRESKRWPGLFVKKYTKRVLLDNLWNEDHQLLESRGHVENGDGKVVVRPLTKIFNRFENETDIDRDETCLAVQKINGFMAAATWVDDVCDVVVSTTGSLDSDFVMLAEKYIGDHVKSYIKSQVNVQPGTYIFEICDPSDPHIIPEFEGAYLIGFRPHAQEGSYFSTPEHEHLLDSIAATMKVLRPLWSVNKFSTIVQNAKTCKHEGFVVYGQQTGTVLKIKSPHYLVLKAVARKKDIMSLNKSKVDEEFYSLINYIERHKDHFNSLNEQQRLTFIRDYLQ